MTLSRKEVCADCGAPGPCWASVNRCVLVCGECVVVHRSLGRQVSDVKAVSDGDWPEGRLQMIYELSSAGSNSVWEHTLLDLRKSAGRTARKPVPTDPARVRNEFIRAKYEALAFVNKPTDDSQEDLSQQLHASCRTTNLKVSLRLLAAGADPNHVHTEKGTTPLHVAAHSGEHGHLHQVHLLLVWGADPLIPDCSGNRPVHLTNSQTLVSVLRDAPFAVTDRLSTFLCGRKGNHETGQHIVLPDPLPDVASSPTNMMHSLDDSLFSELVKDVYDEVDRREKNQSMSSAATMAIVPFLPVNPLFSSTRNQGRQKLATLIRHEFNNLVLDILTEFNRRLTSRCSDITL